MLFYEGWYVSRRLLWRLSVPTCFLDPAPELPPIGQLRDSGAQFKIASGTQFENAVEAPGEDYLGVGLEGGRVKVVWHLGGGSLGHLLVKDQTRSRKDAVASLRESADLHYLLYSICSGLGK
ncbi:hypothetical protein E2C01_032721 [Portunus trituberculatus]|uniref:Uncharacterized protein n=1 Tax=Portunus trituberculatus TaxID=210409 RepID=A0A5B7F0C9_PORTR|nr:hypothetical protein [Portunus trituberculatus]